MVWVYSSSLIQTVCYKTLSCHWQEAQFGVGIAATSITSRCYVHWLIIISLISKHRLTHWMPPSRKPCCMDLAKIPLNSNTLMTAVIPRYAAIHLKVCCTIWSAVIKRRNPVRCAKSWLNSSVIAPVLHVMAHACAVKRVMSLSKTRHCQKSQN
ncbi:Uncharacterised protein [Yersinia enterocolitica]|nr:Uncharacterised protein [Yersinia enterocolitica]